jgi:hypothetical protein
MNRTPKLSNQIKLLILTADGSPDAIYWNDKMNNNSMACICDATKGATFVKGKTRWAANEIKNPSFIVKELSCILTKYYGDMVYEEVDVGCCF